MHDCGKPFCHRVDEHGRSHFPDHASVSSSLWLSLTGNKVESYLMRHDMDIHLLKGCQVEDFASGPFASALLITGLCELHANASMFGGIAPHHLKSNTNKLTVVARLYLALSLLITNHKDFIMNHKLLDTKTFKHAVTKFKELVKSPKAKPRYNEYGTKFRGDTHYIHFAFTHY